ncbi:hypothetical protein ACFFWC_24675 [Plantactinospora siamensis]|uniref:TubC N-terminal docking domain-containing protein n=1 Tax=Plantactinospora siamensis TaxID=555372 RepID=A0ABV6P6K8_9ACTN
MSPADLLAAARTAGLDVRTDGGRLVIRGPQSAGGIAQALLDRKADVLAELARDPGPGHWLGASRTLRRPVPVDGQYPHICGARVTGAVSGRPLRLQPRDCAACQEGRPE